MSRSYKKTPVIKDSSCKGSSFKSGKQIANRAVRNHHDVPSGGSYKKYIVAGTFPIGVLCKQNQNLEDYGITGMRICTEDTRLTSRQGLRGKRCIKTNKETI